MAKIQLNGKKINIKQKVTLIELLRKYRLDNKKIAIELNGVIVAKHLHKILIQENVVGVVDLDNNIVGLIKPLKSLDTGFGGVKNGV